MQKRTYTGWAVLAIAVVALGGLAIAQQAGFLPVTAASQKYQSGATLTPAGGDELTAYTMAAEMATAWTADLGGASSNRLVFVPTVLSDASDDGGRPAITDQPADEPFVAGALFQVLSPSNEEANAGYRTAQQAGEAQLTAGSGWLQITRTAEPSDGSGLRFILHMKAEQNGATVLLVSNTVELTPSEASQVETGEAVTVTGTNRSEDTPVYSAEMTVTFAENGQVIIADVAQLTP